MVWGIQKWIPLIFMKGGNSMEEKTCSFAEKIGGVTFIVNMKPSEEANQTTEEFFKALITKKSMVLETDYA